MPDQIRVLFVDDNVEYVDLATDFFDANVDGITLVGEPDVAEAIDRLTAGDEPAPVDIVVSDYDMPGTDGLEFLERLRDAHPELPFVLLTGQGNEDLAAEAIHRGVSDYLPKGSGTDQFRVLANRIENLAGRARAERSLQTREAHLEALTAAFPDLAFLLDGDGRYLEYFAGEQAADRLYADPEDFLGETIDEVLPEPVATDIHEGIRETLETGETRTLEYELTVPAGTRWFEARVAPVRAGGDADSVVLVARDATDRRRRERTIEQLHETTRDLMRAQTADAVAERAVRAADRILDVTGVAFYVFDDETSSLRPAAHARDLDGPGDDLPTYGKGDGPAWEVFVSGEAAYVADVRDQDGAEEGDTTVRSRVLIPLGDHGVLIARSTTPDAFDETDRDLLHLLASNTESALDRTDRESRLLERERALAESNEELRTVNHLNTVMRDIGRSVTSATTRDELQQTVCDRLTAVERYAAAWLREVDTTVEERTPATWAGFDAEAFDGDDGPTHESAPERELCDAAVESHSIQVGNDVLNAPDWASRRRSALSEEYRSVAAIPVEDDGYVFSVLVLYAEDPDAFGDQETDVLAEVGRVIGHTIHELDKVHALVSDGRLELDIGIGDSRWFPARLSAQAGCRVELGGILPRDDGTTLVFLTTVGGEPKRVAEAVAGWTTDTELTLVAREGEESLFKLVLALPTLVDLLHSFGASIKAVTAEDGDSTVTVGLPPETDVRSLVEAIQAEYSGAELRARHEQTDPLRSKETLKAELIEELTERQFEVLQVAYFGGYFDPKRKSTGDELAAVLDISGPTFHGHLRTAQRKLIASLLER